MKRKIIRSVMMFISVVFAFLFISEKDSVSASLSSALSMCGDVLIPSLFPFMVLSSFSISCGLYDSDSRFVGFIMTKLFRLPPVCFSALIFGFSGGYPVGARIVGELYEKGQIDDMQAKHLLSFCVNAGPAFSVAVAGGMLTGSHTAGLIILLSVSLSSLIVGVVYGRFSKQINAEKCEFSVRCISVTESLVNAVNSAGNGILSVCGWVLAFSAFSSIFRQFIADEKLRLIYDSVAEVTSGLSSAAETGGMPMVAACVSFGGLCVMCQNMPQIKKCGMKISEYLLFRIINSILSFCVCRLLLQICDVTVTVFSSMEPAMHFAPASAALLIMCAVLMCDVVKIRSPYLS